MFEQMEFAPTPGTARRLLLWERINNQASRPVPLHVTEEVRLLATEGLFGEKDWVIAPQLTDKQKDALQYLDDRKGRALFLDTEQTESRLVCATWLRLRNRFPVFILSDQKPDDFWYEAFKDKKIQTIDAHSSEFDAEADVYLLTVMHFFTTDLHKRCKPSALIIDAFPPTEDYQLEQLVQALCAEIYSTMVLHNTTARRKTTKYRLESASRFSGLGTINWASGGNQITHIANQTILPETKAFTLIRVHGTDYLTKRNYPANVANYLMAFGIFTGFID